jgi:hypothetical protein
MEEFPDLFLQLGCGKSLGCPGARTTYRLPYFHASMEVDTIPRFITDAIENWVGGADERCGLRVAATGGGVRFEVRTKELSRYRSRSESTRAVHENLEFGSIRPGSTDHLLYTEEWRASHGPYI